MEKWKANRPLDTILDALVYGEEEPDDEQPIILSRAEPVSVDKPTRKEWLDKMPRQMVFEEWHQWADAFCEWFLTMPGVPKE